MSPARRMVQACCSKQSTARVLACDSGSACIAARYGCSSSVSTGAGLSGSSSVRTVRSGTDIAAGQCGDDVTDRALQRGAKLMVAGNARVGIAINHPQVVKTVGASRRWGAQLSICGGGAVWTRHFSCASICEGGTVWTLHSRCANDWRVGSHGSSVGIKVRGCHRLPLNSRKGHTIVDQK